MRRIEHAETLSSQIKKLVEGKEALPAETVAALVPIHHTSAQVHSRLVSRLLDLLGSWSTTCEEMVSNTHVFGRGRVNFNPESVTRTYSREHPPYNHNLTHALTTSRGFIRDVSLLLGLKGGVAATVTTFDQAAQSPTGWEESGFSDSSYWVLDPDALPLVLKKWGLPSTNSMELHGSPVWVTAEEFEALKRLIQA